jgi:hypothetical protein
MAKPDSEFEELLRDAPMAPDADTVTVVGTLTRTPDAARFNLTLADGRTVTLDVDAVKSAKAIAGAIGQSLVQVALDAKRVPESLAAAFLKARADLPQHTGWLDAAGPNAGHGGGPPTGSVPQIEAIGDPRVEMVAPFVAAAPHHAHPAAIAALTAFGGPRTYLTSPYYWAYDHHVVMKAHTDQP